MPMEEPAHNPDSNALAPFGWLAHACWRKSPGHDAARKRAMNALEIAIVEALVSQKEREVRSKPIREVAGHLVGVEIVP
jgi:hypothetical protein